MNKMENPLDIFQLVKSGLMLFFVCLSLAGCSDSIAENDPLSGKIESIPFLYSVGYYTNPSSDSYFLYLWGEQGSDITSADSANLSIYPYLTITLSSIESETEYSVSTFGVSQNENPGIIIQAPTYANGGILFDSGELTVQPLGGDEIKLIFRGCKTYDNNSLLNGYAVLPLW